MDEWLNMVYSTLMVKNVSSLAEILTRTFSNFIFGSTWSGRSGWLWCWASDCLVFVECRYYRVFQTFLFGLTPLCSIGWPCGGECVSSLVLYNRYRTWHKPPPHGQQTSKSHICKDTIDAKRSGIHLSNPPLLVTWYLGRFIDQLEPPPSSLSYPTPTNELGPTINREADVNMGQRYMVIKCEK